MTCTSTSASRIAQLVSRSSLDFLTAKACKLKHVYLPMAFLSSSPILSRDHVIARSRSKTFTLCPSSITPSDVVDHQLNIVAPSWRCDYLRFVEDLDGWSVEKSLVARFSEVSVCVFLTETPRSRNDSCRNLGRLKVKESLP